ncbi:MAG: 30S ribosomal protein S3ae [Desulfurococcaceae archaeon]
MSSKRKAVVKDKWKLKKWYEVLAPDVFSNVPLGQIPADDPSKLLGRTVEATLYDLTGDISQVHVKLKFQIVDVEEGKALTKFKGHELARDYMRSLIRRKSSKIQAIVDVATADGYKMRITGVVLTSYRCKTSQRRAIRKIMSEHLTNVVSNMTLNDYIANAIVTNKISNEIAELARKIYPVRRVEIYKTKVLAVPSAPSAPSTARAEEAVTSS